jgi:hypothetical protein
MKAVLTAAVASAVLVALQSESADVIRDRLDRYLIAYEPQLSALVADEEMSQRARESRWITNRRMHSEVAFVALPGNAGWLGFRRVVKVNGRAISDRGVPLAQLLSEGASDDFDQARLLLADSAAHNLGAPRTINLPNLPLELLHPRNRHRFAQEVFGREKIRGTPTVVLRLHEIATPTVIQQPGAGDMKSVVWAWVEPASGRLLRAQVAARDVRIGMPPFDAVIRVDFGAHAQLGLLVPVEMQETFFVERGRSGTGTARYTNYRQFKTAGRIVPPPQ